MQSLRGYILFIHPENTCQTYTIYTKLCVPGSCFAQRVLVSKLEDISEYLLAQFPQFTGGAHKGERWCGGAERILKDNIQIPWHELSNGRYAKSFKGHLEGSRCLGLCKRPGSNCPAPSSTSSPTTPLLLATTPPSHYTPPGLPTCFFLLQLCLEDSSFSSVPCPTVCSSRKSFLHPSSPSSALCASTSTSAAL